jgi:hypothetical protein
MDTHGQGRWTIMKEDESGGGTRPAALWNHWLSSVGERVTPDPPSTPAPDPDATRDEASPDDDATLVQSSVFAWQRVWLATQRRKWRSLAVIPAGGPVATLRVARALVGVGSCHLGSRIRVVDATAIRLAELGACLRGLTDPKESRGPMILALGPVLESPASLALAQAADAAVLCLVLGESSIAEAERTIEEVGRARFVGSLVLR